MKLKTGRPRHEKADKKAQEAFKKLRRCQIRRTGEDEARKKKKPLKVLAFDEARFGLINWHKRRYCPRGEGFARPTQ